MSHSNKRRLLEVLPTFFFIGLFCFSLYSKDVLHRSWVNQFAISLVGMLFYAPVTFAIEAFIESSEWYSGVKAKGWKMKLFYAYFVFCCFAPIIIGIYLMNHN